MGEFSRPAEELASEAREYIDLKVDEIKLRTAKGLSVSVAKLLGMVLILGVLSSLLLVLSFGIILLFGEAIGSYGWAALSVAGLLIVVLAVLVMLRDKLFSGSFVQLFVKLFFGGDEDGKI